jgi:hypothetical protein
MKYIKLVCAYPFLLVAYLWRCLFQKQTIKLIKEDGFDYSALIPIWYYKKASDRSIRKGKYFWKYGKKLFHV